MAAEEIRIAESPSCRHAVIIDTGKATLSGILVTRESGDSILGSIINEFGISALDFIYDTRRGKIKLTHTVGFLDKWYIKRTLGNDLAHCLRLLYGLPGDEKRNYKTEQTGETIKIHNTKRKTTYTFTPLKKTATDETGE